MLSLDNLSDGEVIIQRALLVHGRCPPALDDDSLDSHVIVRQTVPGAVTATDGTRDKSDKPWEFPEQRWPMCRGYFKALIILSPGPNNLSFQSSQDERHSISVTVHYTPYLEKPPLYLAILLASDSPLEMDHPPCKQEQCGDKCPASGLDAAIAKLRLAALMWQAFTAEQLRAAGLGRRSFRLEEEEASASNRESEGCGGWSGTATIKVHVIRTHYSVAELREPDLAQQNPAGTKRDKLHEIFSEALKAHGGPFNPACRPIVAGLILDSHYDPPTVSVSDVTGAMAMSTPSDVPTTLPMHPVPTPVPSQRRKEGLILAHAALGSHDPSGLSLGIFGSHLCYSWPSSLSEIPSCLLDTTQPPADAVGNDCGECESFWEACCVGQGAFLHEVGHAFGAPHSSGVMVRGYSPDWAKCFLARTAARLSKGRTRPPVVPVVPEETENECFWDVRDMLRFAMLEHFGSPKLKTPVEDGDAEKCLDAPYFEHSVGMGEDCNRLVIKCEAGIAQLYLNGKLEKGHGSPSIAHPLPEVHFTYEGLMKSVPGFDMTRTLSVEVLALNGRRRKVSNVWSLFSSAASEIRVPGTDIILRKRGISCSGSTGEDDDEGEWHWTVLLKKHACLSTSIEDNTNDTTTSKPTHRLVRATKLSVRVGCALDGAIVHYSDGTSVPCGPRGPEGRDPPMGGHQSRRLVLPRGVDIVKVAVTRAEGSDSTCLFGLRVWLANGKAMGALNCKAVGRVVETLVPEPGHRIIGFYGASGGRSHGMCREFGIVTAPADRFPLPSAIYDMRELQNSPDGGVGPYQAGAPRTTNKHICGHSHDERDVDDDDGNYDESEDSYRGYDDDE